MKIPSPDWGKPKLGRCYANALLFVARNKGWTLVHGIAICSDGTAEPMGHAWAERSVRIPTPAGDAEIEIVADPYMRKLGRPNRGSVSRPRPPKESEET